MCARTAPKKIHRKFHGVFVITGLDLEEKSASALHVDCINKFSRKEKINQLLEAELIPKFYRDVGYER